MHIIVYFLILYQSKQTQQQRFVVHYLYHRIMLSSTMMGRSNDELIAATSRRKIRSRKIEPHRLSSKVKEELSASGVFTAAGVNAVIQKVLMESESKESLRRSALSGDFSARNSSRHNSIDILDGDSDEEQTMTKTQQSLMGKLNASFSNFCMSSVEGLRDELDSSHLSSEKRCQLKRNIAPKRGSLETGKETNNKTDARVTGVKK